jgi:hypothetical protein
MRRIRYVVAMSLDTFIAGPNSESDWVVARSRPFAVREGAAQCRECSWYRLTSP